MATTTQKRITVPLQAGGMWSAGDPGSIPAALLRSLLNVLPQPNRLQVRPPFTYDSLMNVNGLFNFDDPTNKVTRLCGVDTTAHVYTKATSGETWGSANGTTIGGTRVTDYANYRSKSYVMTDNGSGLPSAAFSYDGTTISTTPFNSTFAARTVTAFNDRIYLGYPRVTVAPVQPNVVTNAYDWTNATNWAATNVTASLLTVGTGIRVGRLSPTSTAASGSSIKYAPTGAGMISVAANTSERKYTWRADFRGVDPLYNVPFTMEWIMISDRANTTAYALGDMIASGGYRYRCTTAGTSAGSPPALGTTIGGTTSDGATLVWTNEGTDVLQALENTVPNATTTQWTSFAVTCSVPARTNTIYISPRLKFYNTTYTALTTLAPIDISFKDGIADGDARKANKGQQWTAGDYIYPFINTETATSSTQDVQSIVWSEIADPKTIRGANTYDPWESPGDITAAITAATRYLTFKRRAFWVFLGTNDPDIPIQREIYNKEVGCIGPRAIDSMEDTVYFIGENEVYSYRPGEAAPTPLCGDGMREEIMNKAAAGWVESQSTYKRPLLVIDKTKLLVWVYTQKSTLYCYDIRNQKWSKHSLPNSSEADAMLYNPNTGEVYVALASATYGLARLDFSQTANDTIDNTANTYSVSADIIFRPLELYTPPRFDATLEQVRFLHAATASQTGQTARCSYSFDQGTTYGKYEEVTVAPLSASGEFVPLRFNAFQTAPSITIKLNHTGKAGSAAWTISERAYAMIHVRRGEYIQNNPTAGAATL